MEHGRPACKVQNALLEAGLRRLAVACYGLLLAAGFLFTACAPTVPELLRKERYSEALCAVQQFDQGDQAPLLRRSLRQGLDPGLHIHPLTADELQPALGKATARVHQQAVLLRVRHDSRDGDLAGLAVGVWLEGEGVPGGGLGPLQHRPEALALLTGEILPRERRTPYGPNAVQRTLDTAQRAAGVGADFLETITLGIVPFREMVGQPPVRHSGVIVERPTEAELVRQAPAALALQRTLDAHRFDRQASPGVITDHYLLWPRLPEETGPLRLRLEVWYTADSAGPACEHVDTLTLELPPGKTLEERIRTRFGARMQRVHELVPPIEP